MKLFCIGVKRIAGPESKKSGQPFDMCRLIVGTRIESVSNAKLTIQGFGFEVGEMELAADAVESFKDVRFPAELEVLTDTRQFMGKFETVCVGFKPVAASVKAA